MSDLVAAFGVTEDDPALATALAEAVAAARAAWPLVAVTPDAFVKHLARHLPEGRTPLDGLAGMLAPDLYLACACAANDPRALEAADDILRREASTVAEAGKLGEANRDEALQAVRTILFVPRGDKPPAIADYAGRGPLRGWIRVILTRELVRMARDAARHVPIEDDLLEAPGFADDPELAGLKARYRDQLAVAFRAALATLQPRDRSLLRYQVIDGLTIDEIGAIYKVHRATAARWLARIRTELVEDTLARLSKELGIGRASAASIVRLVQSQLELSVVRHLSDS